MPREPPSKRSSCGMFLFFGGGGAASSARTSSGAVARLRASEAPTFAARSGGAGRTRGAGRARCSAWALLLTASAQNTARRARAVMAERCGRYSSLLWSSAAPVGRRKARPVATCVVAPAARDAVGASNCASGGARAIEGPRLLRSQHDGVRPAPVGPVPALTSRGDERTARRAVRASATRFGLERTRY